MEKVIIFSTVQADLVTLSRIFASDFFFNNKYSKQIHYNLHNIAIWVIHSKSAQILSCNLNAYFIRFYNIKFSKLKIARCPLVFNERGLFTTTKIIHVNLSTFVENHPYIHIQITLKIKNIFDMTTRLDLKTFAHQRA